MNRLFFLLIFFLTTLQIVAQVQKSVVCKPGQLDSVLTHEEKAIVTNLIIAGEIDARDFRVMRDSLKNLSELDLSKITIAVYTGDKGTAQGNGQVVYRENVIPQKAFRGCTLLNSVKLPDIIVAIEKEAFQNCTQLDSIQIPSSVTEISELAFDACRSITSITLPPLLTRIEKTVFQRCSMLKEVNITSPITEIGYMAFYDCRSLSTINIPASVETIGMTAFLRCINLKSVFIPHSVKFIGERAFELTDSVAVDERNSNYSSENGILFNKDKTEILHCPVSFTGKFVIPQEVRKIQSNAFYSCEKLDSLVISSNAKSFGRSAFAKCTNLSSLLFLSLPDSIPDNAFSQCIKLDSVVIPESVKYMGYGAFSGCKSLKSVIIPSFLSSIGEYVFSGCTGLKSIVLPLSVKTIDCGAFNGCTGLENITIPDSVKVFKCKSFAGCTSLKSITIPTGAESIESYAFENCSGLQSVYSYTKKPVLLVNGSDVFVGANRDSSILYVPYGKKRLYGVYLQWKDFKNIVEMPGIEVTSEKKSLDGEGGVLKITLKSNTAWKLESDMEWLTFSETEGSGDAIIDCIAAHNPNDVNRKATITISGEGNALQTIVVNQNPITTVINQKLINQPEIYPNPVTEWLQISNCSNEAGIRILDISGKLLLEQTLTENQLNISDLPGGFYLIQIADNGNFCQFKIIKH